MKYVIEEEGKFELELVINYDEVKEDIKFKVSVWFLVCFGYNYLIIMCVVL